MKYKHLFFDLDHTLWDFDSNARETLLELFDRYELKKLGIPEAESFIAKYTEFNHQLWRDYHLSLITKEELRATRFSKTFRFFQIEENLIPHQFEIDYVEICPTKTNLFPHAHEVLSTLKDRYQLHIITNGFKESSELKVQGSNIDQYFENMFVSEVIGLYKPDPALFHYALNAVDANPQEVIMIGDSLEADIIGARQAGIDQIYFNPHAAAHDENVTHEISSLKDLLLLL